MITVNSISGGATSSYIAMNYKADYNIFSLVCIDDYKSMPKDNFISNYVNEKLKDYIPIYGEFIATAEDDRTIEALIDLEQLMGKPITWVRGRSFDNILNDKCNNMLPSWSKRYCTAEMKVKPIFDYWFKKIGVQVNMRIGFRFDEYARAEKFLQNKAGYNRFPVSCSVSSKKQKHEEIYWRYCSMPLIKDGITKDVINEYWKNKKIPANLFRKEKKIDFPIISNCIGCFHKKPDTLAIMSNMHPEKFNWFIKQEKEFNSYWLDSKLSYEIIKKNSEYYIPEMLNEKGAACDSGGCTD